MSERPKRITISWTQEQIDFLKENIGTAPTETVVSSLNTRFEINRTLKSVHHILSREQISIYNNDGRYTLAEIARITGHPFSTLSEWAKMGKIPGAIRLGRACWKVEWDGQTPIFPSWDGKKGGLYWEGYDPDNPPKTCVICSADLSRHAHLCCSKQCQGIYLSQRFRGKLDQEKPK